MAFRKKADLILSEQPDIVVVPECEHTSKITIASHLPQPTHMLWFGKNQNKGLGIFSFTDFKFRLHKAYNPDFKIIIPLTVSSKQFNFTLFAIWANNPDDREGRYITQIWKAVNHYKRSLKNKQTILIGDFNSNTIWDKPRREGNHSTVVRYLEKKGIHSVYHHYFKQRQGEEAHPTLYMYRNQEKAYHIDYCFASEDLIKNLSSVQIGPYEIWKQHSDHVPLITTFDIGS